jgi:transcriptional regulator with XRE-family HTH domain
MNTPLYRRVGCGHCAGTGQVVQVNCEGLKAARKALRVKQWQIAQIMGCSVSYVSEIERGTRPAPAMVIKVYGNLKVRLEQSEQREQRKTK